MPLNRRTFLENSSLGLGAIALAGLWPRCGQTQQRPAASGSAAKHAPAGFRTVVSRAKRVIFLYMAGGPSHLETFDPKPELSRRDGQPMPASFTEGQPIAQLQGQALRCWGPQASFRQHGKSGQWISDLLPHIATVADDLCIIRSLRTEQINHDPAHTFMNTGTSISGRPSMGSWITYGLGSDCDDLPGFVVLSSRSGRSPQPISTRQWHSGFLPSEFQGVPFHSTGDPVHYIQSPRGVDMDRQRDVVDSVIALNRLRGSWLQDPEIAARIAQYELAFRMQISVPAFMNIADEPQHVLDAYGVGEADGSFAYNCLLARRLSERGVRFVQLYHRGWDHHNDLKKYMAVSCGSVDQATAALLRDLKQRGLLEETLVIWGGEFGRTPMAQGDKGDKGRDHHIRGFSMFLAGGGIRGGISHGATDELGYHAVESIVDVHDLHATMLYLLGIDHERLTYRYQGRDFRLTDVAGRVVQDVVTSG